jgi:2-amino-4-hydroxy-6-hydroxymethyldihydropteridine diphosphokinase
MSGAALIELPAWAQVNERRRGHIGRVTHLLLSWADQLRVDGAERTAWRDAAIWHDALRDAPEDELRHLAGPDRYPVAMLHGPAAAAFLERAGETRGEVLEAIRWHTVGHPEWSRTGRALYMADFLEPGRSFARADRAFLARHVTQDFDGVFRQVVQRRMLWKIGEGYELFPPTVALWNRVR